MSFAFCLCSAEHTKHLAGLGTPATNPPRPFLLKAAEQKQFLTWCRFWREERAAVQVRTCSLKADLG